MKLIFIFLSLIIISIGVHAQGDLDKVTYFRLGYSNPTKHYKGIDNDSYWDVVSRDGFTAELGQIFILNSIPLADGLRLGINVDYLSFYYHLLKENPNEELFFILGSKVGPSISYNPIDKLIIDAFVKINPVWVSTVVTSEEFIDTGKDYQLNMGVLGFGYSLGINVRYSMLMLCIDFNKSWNKIQHYNENSNEFDGTYVGNESDATKDKTPMPSINFTIGLAF